MLLIDCGAWYWKPSPLHRLRLISGGGPPIAAQNPTVEAAGYATAAARAIFSGLKCEVVDRPYDPPPDLLPPPRPPPPPALPLTLRLPPPHIHELPSPPPGEAAPSSCPRLSSNRSVRSPCHACHASAGSRCPEGVTSNNRGLTAGTKPADLAAASTPTGGLVSPGEVISEAFTSAAAACTRCSLCFRS